MTKVDPRWFRNKILNWYEQHGRSNLPWKVNADPYAIWVSEIMLQQTQVETVISYFERFMQHFPNLEALANAKLDKVLQLWSGLGYYARARNLHKTAKIVLEKYQGHFPQEIDLLLALPGIGRSTAGAILAQAFGVRAPILDGNVKRVLSRFHAIDKIKGSKEFDTQLWSIASKLTPHSHVADYTQAMMDMGATCCRLRKPLCTTCPIHTKCLAYLKDKPENFPVRAKKKSVPSRQCLMLIIQHQNKIMMYKRPLKGIWGGLYSFPEFEKKEELHNYIDNLNTGKYKLKPLEGLSHTFTHFKLTINPFLLQTNCDFRVQSPLKWVAIQNISSIGLPSAIKKILRQVM